MSPFHLSPTRFLPSIARWILDGAVPADPLEVVGRPPFPRSRGQRQTGIAPDQAPAGTDRHAASSPAGGRERAA